MHEYVQKSISTTWPARSAGVSGAPPGVLSQPVIPVSGGAWPQSSRVGPPSVHAASPVAGAVGAADAPAGPAARPGPDVAPAVRRRRSSAAPVVASIEFCSALV